MRYIPLKNNSIEDDVAFIGKMKEKKNKDLRKWKSYTCGEYGHFVSKCL